MKTAIVEVGQTTMRELLSSCEHDGSYIPVSEAKRMMQSYAESYHKERVNAITDEDIEKWADDIANPESKKVFERGEWLGFKEGARKIKSKLMEE